MQSEANIGDQTVALLDQLKAQLGCCIDEWEAHAIEIVSLFSVMAEDQIKLAESVRNSALSDTSTTLISEIIEQQSPIMQELQFHDRLNQRMDHVRTSVGMLQKLLKDRENRKLSSEWDQLQEMIASCAAMETDQKRFGISGNYSPSGDIELF